MSDSFHFFISLLFEAEPVSRLRFRRLRRLAAASALSLTPRRHTWISITPAEPLLSSQYFLQFSSSFLLFHYDIFISHFFDIFFQNIFIRWLLRFHFLRHLRRHFHFRRQLSLRQLSFSFIFTFHYFQYFRLSFCAFAYAPFILSAMPASLSHTLSHQQRQQVE